MFLSLSLSLFKLREKQRHGLWIYVKFMSYKFALATLQQAPAPLGNCMQILSAKGVCKHSRDLEASGDQSLCPQLGVKQALWPHPTAA